MSFTVAEGEIVGLIGPNGSGKTTVLNMISGALPASGGSITLAGVALDRPVARPHRPPRHRPHLPAGAVLPSLSVADNVLAALAFRRDPLWGEAAQREALQLLADVGLAGREDEKAANLTYIDQKRMELARALAADPSLLLLDEWLAGLNPTELRIGIDADPRRCATVA